MSCLIYKNVYPADYPISAADTEGERLLAKDTVGGTFFVGHNNTVWDLTVLLFDDPGESSKPLMVPLAPGGTIRIEFPLAAFAIYQTRINDISPVTPPLGLYAAATGGGYTGAGAQRTIGHAGYVTVAVYDTPTIADISTGDRRTGMLVNYSASGVLTAAANNLIFFSDYSMVKFRRGRMSWYWDGQGGLNNGTQELITLWFVDPTQYTYMGTPWYIEPGAGLMRLDHITDLAQLQPNSQDGIPTGSTLQAQAQHATNVKYTLTLTVEVMQR